MSKRRKRPVKKPNNTNVKSISDKSLSFFSWVQEYSKKIVSITFIIFVVLNLFVLGLITIEYIRTSQIYYLDILITEMHMTFREVIGGYIIKAAAENVIKITGPIIHEFIKFKTEKKYGFKVEDDKDITFENISNSNISVDTSSEPVAEDDPKYAFISGELDSL